MKTIQKLNVAATTKNTWVAFLLFLINAIWLTVSGAKLADYSASPKIDFHIQGYNLQQVFDLFTEYGESGRNYYFWLTVLDTPFPFFVAIFGVLYAFITWRKWGVKWLGNVMIIACLSFLIFDNIENALIYRMLYTFPDLNATEIAISSVTTQLKLYSLLIFYVLLPITAIVQLFRLIASKK